MAEKPPLMQTAWGVIGMHVVPPLVAAGIGAFATITVLSERLATIEERTVQAQMQMDQRFSDLRALVDVNKSDTDRRIERIEMRIWPMSNGG